jgi:hypothetical protein
MKTKKQTRNFTIIVNCATTLLLPTEEVYMPWNSVYNTATDKFATMNIELTTKNKSSKLFQHADFYKRAVNPELRKANMVFDLSFKNNIL